MGFPGLSNVSAGVFAILMINTALSMAAIKDVLKSLFQLIGFRRDPETDDTESPWMFPPEDSSLNSGLVLPAMCDEIRSSLPVTCFDPRILQDFSSSEDAQCAVCLTEFETGIDVHQLPRCNHVFHRACLDKWLDHQQTTCPLCRASLISDELSWRYRRREQELIDELILWFSSFHGSAYHGLWWQN